MRPFLKQIGFIVGVLSGISIQAQVSLNYQKLLDSALLLSDRALAIEVLKEAVTDMPDDDTDTRAIFFLRLGRLHGNNHQYALGEYYYRQGLNLGLVLTNDQYIGQGYLGIGGVKLIHQLHFPEDADYDSVMYYFAKALPYLIRGKDSTNVTGLYENISLILTNQGEYDSAELVFSKGLIRSLEEEDTLGVIANLNNMALLERRRENYKKAEAFYIEAFQLAKSDSLLTEMMQSKLGLARSFQEQSDYQSALVAFLEYDSINERREYVAFQRQIAESETKYQTAEKQAEIDRSKRQIMLLTTVLISSLIISIIAYFFVRQRRLLTKASAEKAIQELLQKQEIQTAYALLEGQDKERKRIASELHDNLGSILTSLNMFSDALIVQKGPQKMKEIAKKVGETSNLANHEVRKISHSLDSGLLKHFGLKSAIENLIEAIEASKKFEIEVEVQVEEGISHEKGIEVYRIVQELSTNVLKHAQCTKVRLDISHVQGDMSIIFQDDGVGFDSDIEMTGMGLRNIKNRVSKIGGTYSIESQVGKGSTFIIELIDI